MFSIGLLGASGIAPAVTIKPAARRADVEVAAIASRSRASATAYAEKWAIPRAYGSYEELLADDTIDLVYVALPPSEHARWAIAALRAGKDVLCEKPFAMNAHQARAMRSVADSTGRRLIEAFHDRYHPLSRELDLIRASGRLGDLVSLTAVFDAPIPFDPAQFRHNPALGGGALMDLGCYPVHWVRALLQEEPIVTASSVELNELGADLSFNASLTFPSGTTAQVSSTMSGDVVRSPFDVVGTLGNVHVENMIFPSRGHSITEVIGGVESNRTVEGMETYDHQLATIMDAIVTGSPLPTEGDDPIANMTVIDAIYEAAGVDRPVPVDV